MGCQWPWWDHCQCKKWLSSFNVLPAFLLHNAAQERESWSDPDNVLLSILHGSWLSLITVRIIGDWTTLRTSSTCLLWKRPSALTQIFPSICLHFSSATLSASWRHRIAQCTFGTELCTGHLDIRWLPPSVCELQGAAIRGNNWQHSRVNGFANISW